MIIEGFMWMHLEILLGITLYSVEANWGLSKLYCKPV